MLGARSEGFPDDHRDLLPSGSVADRAGVGVAQGARRWMAKTKRTPRSTRKDSMSLTSLVSYDDTPSDRDALMLARILGAAGAQPILVYVRHATCAERSREELEEHAAQELLGRGARWLGGLGDPHATRIVVSASTAEGLRRIAAQEHADLVIFGSDYRTPAGHVAPQRSTQTLLDGGPTAVAIAPAGYRSDRVPRINTIGCLSSSDDDAALVTGWELAERFDADLVPRAHGVDLLVVGSRDEAPAGRVMVSARARIEIESATAPVLVVARGVPLRFAVPATA